MTFRQANVRPTIDAVPTWRPTTVVLDSTEISRDWRLRGLDFKLLKYLNEAKGVGLAVPASVIEEVVANYERSYRELEVSFKRLARECRRLGLESPDSPAPERPYRETLNEALESVNVTVLPWPNVSHKDLVARAVSRKPPFDQGGGGYRDSLVWATTLACAIPNPAVSYSQPPHVVLVSQDKIFADGDGRLAEPLALEAEQLGLSVELARDLLAWTRDQIPDSEGMDLRDVTALARDGRLAESLAQSDFPVGLEVDPIRMGLPRSSSQVTITDHRGYDLESIRSTRLASNETLVEYSLTVAVVADVDVSRDDADANGWEYTPIGSGVRAVAEVEMTLRGRLDAIFDPYDDGFDINIELLDRVEPSQPWVDTGIGAPVEPWNIPLPGL